MRIFDLDISTHTLESAAEHVVETAMRAVRFEYVVTPNLDHIVTLEDDRQGDFRRAYDGAVLLVADGWPVVLAGRILGAPIPERVAGSDLVPAVLEYADSHAIPLSVFVLGGLGDVPQRASEHIGARYPNIKVVGSFSPPYGFDRDPEQNALICARIRASKANLIIIGLGAPKQEKWAYAMRDSLPPGVGICAGAVVDFLAGSVPRAPVWVQQLRLEWLYRMSREPKRLAGRYAKGMVRFPIILMRHYLKHKFS